MEGALIKLAALASLAGGRITPEMARGMLCEYLVRTDSAVTVGDIEAIVTTYFGIMPADVHSSRRTRTVSAARAVAMFLARRHTEMSYPEIARYMGKNHSSVVLAVQRIEKLLAAGGELVWSTPAGKKAMPIADLLDLLREQIR